LFIPTAYAAGFHKEVEKRFIEQINKYLKSFDDAAINTGTDAGMKVAAKSFNEALDIFVHNLDNAKYALKDVVDDMDVIRAFVNVAELTAEGAANRVRKFANNSGYTLGYGKDLMSSEEFIKAFADMPVHKLNDQAKKAVAGLINTFQNDGLGFNVTKGNIAHVLMITDQLKRTDIEILSVELVADKLTTARDVIFKGRRYDIVVKENGKIVFLEVKNISNNTLQSTLSNGMALKQTAKKADDAVEEIGQLYNDIVSYMKNNNSGHQWVFTPAVMPNVKDSFSAYEDVIIKDIKKLVKKHEKRLAAEFGFDDLTNAKQKKDWGDMVDDLHEAMDGADANGVKFVQIYPFNNTIKKID
jgi:PBP1b-binding outer membrane lipoprotein LpoB